MSYSRDPGIRDPKKAPQAPPRGAPLSAAQRQQVRTELAERIRQIEAACAVEGLGPVPRLSSVPFSTPDVQAEPAATPGRKVPRPQRAATGKPALRLGLAAVDACLGGGLATGCVHEIGGPSDEAAACGFATALLARLARRGPVVWITPQRAALYAPGLCSLGLAPDRLVVIEASARAARLWAANEALRVPGLAAMLVEADAVDFKLSRRLQLTAAGSGASALILDEGPLRRHASAARTRWRVTAARSDPAGAQRHSSRGLASPRWHLELLRGPAAATGSWLVECTTEGLRHVEPHAPSSVDRSASVERSAPGAAAALPGVVASLSGGRQDPAKPTSDRRIA